jgi:hypothetical protein
MSLKVRFTIAYKDESVSFSTVDEVKDDQLREAVWHQLLKWSQSMRELSIRHMIAQETSGEVSRLAQVRFDSPEPAQAAHIES